MEYFDTLSVYDQLRGARFDEEACRVLSNIFRDTQKQQLELLATKRDVEEIKGSIEALRLTTQRDIEEFRQETKKDIEVLRAEVKRDIEVSGSNTIKWVVGLLLAQSALIITAIKFLK
ncbi:MAG: hypothetical protein HQK56_16720 [Deltaproteobacteria bacterium]|nr:hypothetical protein [Deltaproteobacteria bacterium]